MAAGSPNSGVMLITFRREPYHCLGSIQRI
jgi:hypothetical protein